jgi:hypothetical protein
MNIPEDVTANNGTTINFIGLTPTTNDVIEIVGLTPNVALANAIPITGGTISGGLNIAGNLIPTSDNTYYLGSATNRWHSLFVGPGSIDIGGLKLSNVGGVLSISSPGSPPTPIAGEDTWVRAQANASFIKANTPSDVANSAALYANGAFIKANSAAQYDANTVSTGYLAVPIGNTAQRPASAANGVIRYNTTLGRLEGYMPGGGWLNILSDSYPVEYLIVAGGGGGGGAYSGGGGGAGGLLTAVGYTVLPNQLYTVTVGAGGAISVTNTQGNDGSNSAFGTGLTAFGGGGGGVTPGTYTGRPGGSGGGAERGGNPGGTPYPLGGTGTPGQGYPGGLGFDGVSWCTAGGGGGGAGAAGSDSPRNQNAQNNAGPGGVGLEWYGTFYAGGGGGGNDQGTAAATGGNGGGGNGGVQNTLGTTGSTNRGGGGGGGSNTQQGTAGGSGIVVIRYLGAQRGTGGTITSSGGYTIHTFTGSGSFTA